MRTRLKCAFLAAIDRRLADTDKFPQLYSVNLVADSGGRFYIISSPSNSSASSSAAAPTTTTGTLTHTLSVSSLFTSPRESTSRFYSRITILEHLRRIVRLTYLKVCPSPFVLSPYPLLRPTNWTRLTDYNRAFPSICAREPTFTTFSLPCTGPSSPPFSSPPCHIATHSAPTLTASASTAELPPTSSTSSVSSSPLLTDASPAPRDPPLLPPQPHPFSSPRLRMQQTPIIRPLQALQGVQQGVNPGTSPDETAFDSPEDGGGVASDGGNTGMGAMSPAVAAAAGPPPSSFGRPET
ncbi:hypothetical protein V8E53_003794, partial [Lactarius tabidus]